MSTELFLVLEDFVLLFLQLSRGNDEILLASGLLAVGRNESWIWGRDVQWAQANKTKGHLREAQCKKRGRKRILTDHLLQCYLLLERACKGGLGRR